MRRGSNRAKKRADKGLPIILKQRVIGMNVAELRTHWPGNSMAQELSINNALQIINHVLYLVSAESDPDKREAWVEMGQSAVDRLAALSLIGQVNLSTGRTQLIR
jgi:hypothetical protein